MAGVSEPFLLLAATLLDTISLTSKVDDELLLQLHAIFGPMLMSALQLVDRREVVRVTLPGGRMVYQVTSSTGLPYTLYLDPPSKLFSLDMRTVRNTSDTSEKPHDKTQPFTPRKSEEVSSMDVRAESRQKEDRLRQLRISDLQSMLRATYCPCAGFLFNSVGGEKNYLCKHLLAVLIGHFTDKVVHTEVGMNGVAALLGLSKMEEDHSRRAVERL